MAGRLHYLPGTRAVLVFSDEDGTSRTSFIEVVRECQIRGHDFYEIKAKSHILSYVTHVTPFRPQGTELEKGWTVGLVEASALRPLGTTSFHIVPKGESQ
jgi:hypothetical protein